MNNYIDNSKKHIFIIGCKGIPSNYGGFETFVDKLTRYHDSSKIQFHVACAVDDLSKEKPEFEYNNAHCFNIQWKKLGAARAIFYDIDAMKYCINYIKINGIKNPTIYVLACRIGPFVDKFKRQIKALGGKIFVNPDGHEWKRSKWSAPIRFYWKLSEKLMVKHADLLICDSKNIERYIKKDYEKFSPKTTYIAYGAEMKGSALSDTNKLFMDFLNKHDLQSKKYYLVVGRFVPENNFETMIREFMASKSKKDFAIITNVSEKFLEELKKKTGFHNDKRIKFVGTVYDEELLKKIREKSYGYFHGHEVGGTNPSLLEALASTDLNLLLDVGFNKEVAEDGALYWNKTEGNLADLIYKTDEMNDENIALFSEKAKSRIRDHFSWNYIVELYQKEFLKD